MKTYKIYIIALFTISLYACEKEHIDLYEGNSGLYFTLGDEMLETTYSFFKNPGIDIDTVNLQVFVVGNIADYDRTFSAEIVQGENTDAPEASFEILEGRVDSGATTGILPVRIVNVPELATSTFSIEIKLVPSTEFPLIDFAFQTYKLSFSSILTKPENWDDYLSYWFGETYSDNWLLFIVESTSDPDIGSTMHPDIPLYIAYGYPLSFLLSFFP